MKRTAPAHKVFPILEAPGDSGCRILEARERFLQPGYRAKPSINEAGAPAVRLGVVGATHQNSCQPAVHEDKPTILFSGEAAAYANALPVAFMLAGGCRRPGLGSFTYVGRVRSRAHSRMGILD